MSISERAIEKSNGRGQQLVPAEMPERERSIVEEFRIVALQHVDAEGAANLMEELKTTTLESMKQQVVKDHGGEMADNKAERIVKSSPEWRKYITDMCDARKQAHKLKLQLEYIRMKERQMDREYWHGRSEQKMGRSVT